MNAIGIAKKIVNTIICICWIIARLLFDMSKICFLIKYTQINPITQSLDKINGTKVIVAPMQSPILPSLVPCV